MSALIETTPKMDLAIQDIGVVNLLSVEALIRQEGVSTDRDRILYAAAVPVTSCQRWNGWAMTWR